MIRNHFAANLGIKSEDFGHAPFLRYGVLGKVHQRFYGMQTAMIAELNETLAA
ncbi:hypothetical protein [Acidithiobacillus sp. AMEEHan]|uniref:hypothetical protein n=1 Tax=Acidithiobacillus sp. AMEEHan TaxID=2994951 RepID=UPI0027E5923C|nr:hypothetical protein [Acidithiobacillus sp. AMEEHan]